MGCSSSKTAKDPVETAKEPVDSKLASNREADEKAAKTEPEVEPEAAAPVDVIEFLNEVFDQLDINGDGVVSESELSTSLDQVLECSHEGSRKTFKTLLAESGLNPYFNIFDQLDTNHDGKITREEFQENMHPSRAAKAVEQKLKDIFDRMDENGDGSLSREEVSKAFADILGTSCIKSRKSFKALMVDAGMNPDFYVFEQLDANKDGKVTWEEFRARLQPPFDVTIFLRSVFSQVSANENGAVSKEELTKRFECMLDCSDAKSKKTFRALVQEAGLKAEFYVFEKPSANGGERITWEEFEASLKPAGVGQDAEVSAFLVANTAPGCKTEFVVEGTEAVGSSGCLCGGR